MVAVSVDNDFARFGSKSYAINKINSVEVRERKPNGQAGVLIFGALGLFLLVGSLGDNKGFSPGVFGFSLALFALAFWQWQRSKIREYLLFLMTSSSETQAFISRDREEVLELRDQVENAMLHHSRAGTRAA